MKDKRIKIVFKTKATLCFISALDCLISQMEANCRAE